MPESALDTMWTRVYAVLGIAVDDPSRIRERGQALNEMYNARVMLKGMVSYRPASTLLDAPR